MKKIVLLSVLSLSLLTGCPHYGGGIIIDSGYSPYMPPAHAPAYGRRHHLYHYYPNAEFYFDVGRNMYFYMDTAGHWSFSVNLPLHLRSHLRNGYVEVEMEQARPYLRHKYYKNKYKKNKKYKRKYNNSLKYNNGRKYNNDRKYRNDSKYRDERKYKSGRQYNDDRYLKNERKYKEERRYKEERKYKYKDGNTQKKNKKYKDDNEDKSRSNKNRRNDLY